MTGAISSRLLASAFVSFSIVGLTGCFGPLAMDFDGMGTRTGALGSRPISLPLSLRECDSPSLQVGPSCDIPVQIEGAGSGSFARTFTGEQLPHRCVIDGQAVTVSEAWGAIGGGGFLEVNVAAVDGTGKLEVIQLRGEIQGRRHLTTACLPEPAPPGHGTRFQSLDP